MDVGLVNPFLIAAVDILGKVGGITAEVKKPFLKSESESRGAISGMVSLKGKTEGTAAISFSEACILSIVSKMFGEEVTEVNDDVKDAVGEITNMISGQATQLYDQENMGIKADLEQVVMGDKHSIPHLPQHPVLGVPIQTDKGEIVVELCFKKA